MDSEDSRSLNLDCSGINTSEYDYAASDEHGKQHNTDTSDCEFSSSFKDTIKGHNVDAELNTRTDDLLSRMRNRFKQESKAAMPSRGRGEMDVLYNFFNSYTSVTIFDFRHTNHEARNMRFEFAELDKIESRIRTNLKVRDEDSFKIEEKHKIEVASGMTLTVNVTAIIKDGSHPERYVIVVKKSDNSGNTTSYCVPLQNESTPDTILATSGMNDNADHVLFYNRKVLERCVPIEYCHVPPGAVLVAIKRKKLTKSFVYNIDSLFSHIYHINGENIDTTLSFKSKLKDKLNSRLGITCEEEQIYIYNNSCLFSDSDQPFLNSSDDEYNDDELHQYIYIDISTLNATEAKFACKTKCAQSRWSRRTMSGRMILEPDMSFHKLRQKVASHSHTDPMSLKLFINGEKVPIDGCLKEILVKGKSVSVVGEICEECTVRIISCEAPNENSCEQVQYFDDITLQIYKLESVKTLKQKIADKLNIPRFQINLTCNNIPLQLSHKTIKEYGVRNYSTVNCFVYRKRICLFVKIVKFGKEIVLINNPDVTTVLDVINVVVVGTSLQCSSFKAVFNLSFVDGKGKLTSLGVKDGDLITLLPYSKDECPLPLMIFQADISGRIDIMHIPGYVQAAPNTRKNNQCILATREYCNECQWREVGNKSDSAPVSGKVSGHLILSPKREMNGICRTSTPCLLQNSPMSTNDDLQRYDPSTKDPNRIRKSNSPRRGYRHKDSIVRTVSGYYTDGCSSRGKLIGRETKSKAVFEEGDNVVLHEEMETTLLKTSVPGNLPFLEMFAFEHSTPRFKRDMSFENGIGALLGPDVVGDSLINEISLDLVKHWKVVARRLGISESEIEEITEKHSKHLREQAHQMLITWRQAKGKEATRKSLATALEEEKLMNIVHKYRLEKDSGMITY